MKNEEKEQKSGAKTEIDQMKSRQRKEKGRAERIWKPRKLRFHDKYHYVSKNPGLLLLHYFAVFVGMPFVYLYMKKKYGFHVIGKENAKPLKKKSAVMVANHVHDLDSMMITRVFYPKFPYVIALRHNFEAFVLGGLVRVLKAVPLPDETKHFERFYEQVSDLLKNTTHKVHMYPEGEIDHYSKQLRKFKNGAFSFAVRAGVPVLPMVFVFNSEQKVRLIVGKPIYLEDVPSAMDVKEPKQVILFSDYVKNAMQEMMDGYYGGTMGED